jgi:cytochrome P450
MATTVSYDARAVQVADDPYPLFAELRRVAPVFWNDRSGCFLVTRYDDAVAILTSPEIFASGESRAGASGSPAGDGGSQVSAEVAAHAQYRSRVAGAFTNRFVADLEGDVRRLTEELIDGFAPSGRVDLVPALAAPLPTLVLARALGVPDEDRALFAGWAECYSRAMDDNLDAKTLGPTVRDAMGYFAYRLERSRAQPGTDLLSRLTQKGPGETLLSQALLLCDQLMVAGRDLTTGLITNAVAALLSHPEQLARLRSNGEALDGAVEESLRWDPPVLGQARVSCTDTELRGVPIPAGSTIMVMFAAANRDPAVFVDPDRFDIERVNAAQHLAFGRGLHFCLGAALARLEARVALRSLLGRLPSLRLDAARPPVRRGAPFMVNLRAFRSLPIAFDPQ